MTPIDLIGVVLFLAVLAAPIWATGRLTKAMLRRRRLLLDELSARGTVHTFDIPLMLGVVIFGSGAVMAAIALLPGLIWALDGDTEARRVFLVMWPVVALFALLARFVASPALKIWINEPQRLVMRRIGVRHRDQGDRRERALAHADITGLHERRSLLGVLQVRGPNQLTVPMQAERFDELVSALRRATPGVTYTSWRDAARARSAVPPTDESGPATYAIPKGRTRTTVGFLALFFVFFCTWPWFLVTGDHPTRDSFIFVGIGLGLWAIVAALVSAESFQRHQPSVLELRSRMIAWKTFRQGWRERDVRDVVTATVETDIIYVRGFPGYRHPLRLTFVDGSRLEIDDSRARHLQTSTHQLGEAVRAHIHDLDSRSSDDEAVADRLTAEADSMMQSPEPEQQEHAADLLRRAIARHPSPSRLARLRDVADLERRLENFETAVSLYRAHLDVSPDDAAAWEGLGASYRAKARHDLAAEATQTAERLLLQPQPGPDLSE